MPVFKGWKILLLVEYDTHDVYIEFEIISFGNKVGNN